LIRGNTQVVFQPDDIERVQKQIQIATAFIEASDIRMTPELESIPYF